MRVRSRTVPGKTLSSEKTSNWRIFRKIYGKIFKIFKIFSKIFKIFSKTLSPAKNSNRRIFRKMSPHQMLSTSEESDTCCLLLPCCFSHGTVNIVLKNVWKCFLELSIHQNKFKIDVWYIMLHLNQLIKGLKMYVWKIIRDHLFRNGKYFRTFFGRRIQTQQTSANQC